MKRRSGLFALLGVLVAAGCASEGPPRTFDNNELELITGNAARMSCSCLFVMNMSEEYCRAWTKASPNLARWTADLTNKRVDASTWIAFSARARWIDERHGCILE